MRKLDDIEDGKSYVASGKERFVPMPYENILDSHQQALQSQATSSSLAPAGAFSKVG